MTDEWTAWDTNIDKYKALEKCIENMFVYLLKEVSSHTSDWVFPYFKTTYTDGTPLMDGNPIFSAKNTSTKRIIKITVDDGYDDIFEYDSLFAESLLHTIVSPSALIDKVNTPLKDFLALK